MPSKHLAALDGFYWCHYPNVLFQFAEEVTGLKIEFQQAPYLLLEIC